MALRPAISRKDFAFLLGRDCSDDFWSDSDLAVIVEFEPGHVPGLRYFAMERELSVAGIRVPIFTRRRAPKRS